MNCNPLKSNLKPIQIIKGRRPRKHSRTSSFFAVSSWLLALSFDLIYFTLNTLVRISSIKHHLVIEDCKRLRPTKAVKNNQFMLIQIANRILSKINIPAIALIIRSFIFLCFKFYIYMLNVFQKFGNPVIRQPSSLVVLFSGYHVILSFFKPFC